jgi:hypothetical protein
VELMEVGVGWGGTFLALDSPPPPAFRGAEDGAQGSEPATRLLCH